MDYKSIRAIVEESIKLIHIHPPIIKDFPIFAILWRISLFRRENTDQQPLIL